MELDTLTATRRSLHGVAELVLAGPQYRQSADIRLRATPGGFGTVASPELRVDGHALTGAGELRVRINGRSCAELAAAAGITASALRDVYPDGPPVSADEPLVVDAAAASLLAEAFAAGDHALRALAPEAEPVLWPEHFDIAISLDEVNYGVSPGDTHIAEPYAYVGPWQFSGQLDDFWNFPFGAARPLRELPDILAFFREGRRRAS